jgi:hypothetical protein
MSAQSGFFRPAPIEMTGQGTAEAVRCAMRLVLPVASNAEPGGGRTSGMLVTDQIDGRGEDHLGCTPAAFFRVLVP